MKKRYVWMAAGALLVIVAAGACATFFSADEPPIYVLNGSLDFQAGTTSDGAWAWKLEAGGDDEDTSPSYSHEPPSSAFKGRDKTLYVKVFLKSGDCGSGSGGKVTADGNEVKVTFSNNKSFHLKRAKNGNGDYRTRVRPQPDLTAEGAVLRYSADGYLKQISVGGWSCDFTTRDMLDKVGICATNGASLCR